MRTRPTGPKGCLAAVAALAIILTGCEQGTPTPTPQAPAPAPSTPPPSSPPPASPPPATSEAVSISGAVTFDRVPLNPITNGLNYNATRQDPVRRAPVEAVDGAGNVIATTLTDDQGTYSLQVPPQTNVQIRVPARISSTSGAIFDIQILDNTNDDALYVLAGSLTSSGTANSTRNLNAPSGWDGTQYSSTRAAGPFALLDTMLDSLISVTNVDPDVSLPDLDVFWSPQNRPVDGDFAAGEIRTSFFSTNGTFFRIAILGAANTDTDEYDSHVVAHEFGHFLEAAIARSDSIGGPHNDRMALDLRVALSEGFANAYSSIVLGDPVYRDSGGNAQANGFSFSVENNNYNPEGWFNEGSVQSIVQDVFDVAADGPDALAVGFGPIYRAITSSTYVDTPEVISIFALIEALAEQPEIDRTALLALLAPQSINATESSAAGETNNGGNPDVLPVFKTITANGAATRLCSTDRAGTQNNLGVADFGIVTLPLNTDVTITAVRVSGATSSDPDIRVFSRGRFIGFGNSADNNREQFNAVLAGGENVIEIVEFANTTESIAGRDVCFNVTVSSL